MGSGQKGILRDGPAGAGTTPLGVTASSEEVTMTSSPCKHVIVITHTPSTAPISKSAAIKDHYANNFPNKVVTVLSIVQIAAGLLSCILQVCIRRLFTGVQRSVKNILYYIKKLIKKIK